MADKASPEMIAKVLSLVPQQFPFRFVDEIIELTESSVIGRYTFREDEYFYKGHFPQWPTTPGVILVECMAQITVVSLGIYLHLIEGGEMNKLTLFTETEVEFGAVVLPGQRVTVYGEKVYYRKGKLKSQARLVLDDGTVAASGTLAGMGVVRS
jgi:3-hydroxyacyl-[acyl-carrier-protein] dehydratase